MLVAFPKEIKDHEYRVGGTPELVQALVAAGHKVKVQAGAGSAVGFSDEAYKAAGAQIVQTAQEAFAADLIVKVKEPQPSEFGYFQPGQVLFTYLHLAPDPEAVKELIKSKIVAIAYETVTDRQGRLPLLHPMSEIAGRISIQAGATALHMANGGRGVLLGGVPGVLPGKVVIVGAGVVGTNAARMAMGLGADVTILDHSLVRMRELDDLFGPRLKTRFSTPAALEEEVCKTDLLVGAVLIPGGRAPRLVTEKLVRKMKPGSVIVDVSIDQGGFSETSRPTTHSAPTYVEHGVVHYCVTNMPGACARTATQALTNATYPYVLALANKGWKKALMEDPGLREGLNVCQGSVTNLPVAQEQGYDWVSPEKFL